ncbi:MAG: 16S rRNA (guanine(527)-N(7))-methyltransferase RsmG [Geminicoccaceae bacterium]|nr:16S rRNA (guanine(527)-N(7))-methyltransferase RsmG [Geminicoccaceae bacterium]
MSEPAPLDPGEFARTLPVSRETLERLQLWLDELRRWQARINLVGPSTLDDPWRRHILDCAQLVRFLPPETRRVVDLGSGAGLPGLILAILGVPEVHLVESDRRKAAFLLNCKGKLGLHGVVVHAARAEDLNLLPADVVTARALAPLEELLPLALRFAHARTRFLFLKGREVESELTRARRSWKIEARLHPSLSSPEGRVLEIEQVRAIGTEPDERHAP